MSAIILVSGAPATGKTALSADLSRELGVPVLSKDMFKERLFDFFPYSTRELGRKLSDASYALLGAASQELARASMTHIVDINYDPIRSAFFEKDQRIINVHLACDYEILRDRYCSRARSTERDQRHSDLEFLESVDKYFINQVRPNIPGIVKCFAISTEQFSKIDSKELAKKIELLL